MQLIILQTWDKRGLHIPLQWESKKSHSKRILVWEQENQLQNTTSPCATLSDCRQTNPCGPQTRGDLTESELTLPDRRRLRGCLLLSEQEIHYISGWPWCWGDGVLRDVSEISHCNPRSAIPWDILSMCIPWACMQKWLADVPCKNYLSRGRKNSTRAD